MGGVVEGGCVCPRLVARTLQWGLLLPTAAVAVSLRGDVFALVDGVAEGDGVAEDDVVVGRWAGDEKGSGIW